MNELAIPLTGAASHRRDRPVLGARGDRGGRGAGHGALPEGGALRALPRGHHAGLAVFYLAEGAVFLGVVQIVVYTGAIMMLFLFVVMLVGVTAEDAVKEPPKGQRVAAVLCGLGFGVMLIVGIGNAGLRSFTGVGAANAAAGGNVQGLALRIFSQYVWAFEVTGALLITAAIGAMVLTHREHTEERQSQRELAEQRVRLGTQITPLPAPGVYARHNAVDVPGAAAGRQHRRAVGQPDAAGPGPDARRQRRHAAADGRVGGGDRRLARPKDAEAAHRP